MIIIIYFFLLGCVCPVWVVWQAGIPVNLPRGAADHSFVCSGGQGAAQPGNPAQPRRQITHNKMLAAQSVIQSVGLVV